MNKKEIINNILKKAHNNGFIFKGYKNNPERVSKIISCSKFKLRGVVFNHEFAKAFWGKQKHTIIENCRDMGDCAICCNENGNGWDLDTEYCWQHRLQQMVIEEDLIKYLEKFI